MRLGFMLRSDFATVLPIRARPLLPTSLLRAGRPKGRGRSILSDCAGDCAVMDKAAEVAPSEMQEDVSGSWVGGGEGVLTAGNAPDAHGALALLTSLARQVGAARALGPPP